MRCPRGGSSPRVRGKLVVRGGPGSLGRLIPARAGKTMPTALTVCKHWAHPRACGENKNNHYAHQLHGGSSPRVRGKRVSRSPLAGAGRLIPARAGKTQAQPPIPHPHPAHPRACGENRTSARKPHARAGSSPRVRGKRTGEASWRRVPGLIPARAGKTQRHRPPPGHGWAHPRACGENPRVWRAHDPGDGSSPRVRGKRVDDEEAGRGGGLIPARAGKTSALFATQGTVPAHPRACGENATTRPVWRAGPGSSPRVRGKRTDEPLVRAHVRLIPARAGKTH